MSNGSAPSGIASAIKILTETIQNVFAAIVVVIIFFGVSLVSLLLGAAELSEPQTVWLIKFFAFAMLALVVVLIALRVWRPSGLGGPPFPSTENVAIENSSVIDGGKF